MDATERRLEMSQKPALVSLPVATTVEIQRANARTHFFMTIHRNAFPSV